MKKNDFIVGNKNMEDITAIASDAVNILSEMDIWVNNPHAILAISKVFLDCAVKRLVDRSNEQTSSDGSVELDIFDLFTLGIDSNENEDDENNNNRVPFARPLKAFKLAVKDDHASGNVEDFDEDDE